MTLAPLQLHTEPYGSTGNIGENFLRLLGTPSLDPLHTVIREGVQNIADAAKLGRGPEVLIRLRGLTPEQRACMRSTVLADLPAEPASRRALRRFLHNEQAVVLEICDFGTTGLGGPTRADRIPVGTDRTDFINFLRNIGTPRDTDQGGGTYGFGKAALYAVSQCRTILVDTLVADAGEDERRLIGCHVGARFEVPENGMKRQFTGRHWWGQPDPSDGLVDPLRGDAAANLAAALGLPPRDRTRTGTSIMMLDFVSEDEDLVATGRRIIEGLLWSFWPRMMAEVPPERRFSCVVEVNGETLEMPKPEEFPPLDLFCKAMRLARSGEGDGVRQIVAQRPRKHLGVLAVTTGLRGTRTPLVAEDSLFPAISQHIALMRPIELVVKYLRGTAHADDRLEWAGVFLVDRDDEVEAAFAVSEPPAHDDWIPGNLPRGHARTFVNVALRELEQCAGEAGALASGEKRAGFDGTPLARVAGRLGAALESLAGEGAGPGRAAAGRTSIRRPMVARASRPIFERLVVADGRRAAIFSTVVSQDSDCSGAFLEALPSVALDGAGFDGLDGVIELPELICIRREGEGETPGVRRLPLNGTEGRFEIVVSVPEGCAVTVEAKVLTDEDA